MKYKLKLNYTKIELDELKQLSEYYDSPMSAVGKIVRTEGRNQAFGKLWLKYESIAERNEFDLMADINNAVMGTAIFPEQQLYYVLDGYINSSLCCSTTVMEWSHKYEDWRDCRIFKTKEEWIHLNPAYESMLAEVEE
ncbi:MAG: hypothetical protein LKE77_08370 [Companilactobacillus sp.]|jgi:hypothetical protein|uniref:hypothetical protein n=1 Tax=Companilactobacillus sp. TaxID=2767905 RepID=UPI0025BA8D5F|nr:hypothetical protein [Companilactobacillus sp.]MCH4010355.1 hypothetical protein [Companilactobacillus sp.]MCH4051969.1 hypothetical protein [Companilactobacillus sp.]MCH4075795.1 hypothetical protein [Companilactobacillus sp.]MCH4126873.1 hypothetical protein [Companilactobacillus sp.]